MLGVTYSGMTAPLAGPDEPTSAAARSATTRRHSMLGTATAARGTTPVVVGPATTTSARRHSMLGAPPLAAAAAGRVGGGHVPPPAPTAATRTLHSTTTPTAPTPATTRRNSMLGVSYGGMTAPLADNIPEEPEANPSQEEDDDDGVGQDDEGRVALPDLLPSTNRAERRLSMPKAEIGPASRMTMQRSSSLVQASTSSIIRQTKRLSLTEIQQFMDSDNDDSEVEQEQEEQDDEEEGDNTRRTSERRLSMPKAEIGARSRETIRSRSLTSAQIATRRLSLTEVQKYLDGDSSDDEDEDVAAGEGAPPLTPSRRHSIGSVASHQSQPRNMTPPTPSRRHSIASVSSHQSQSRSTTPPTPSHRHSIASGSSHQSQPKSVLRRHSSLGNSSIPSEEPRPTHLEFVRRASLQQTADSLGPPSTTSQPRRDRSTSIGSTGSSVSFSSVSVRSHSQTLGDHPCCHEGPPIALDWEYDDHRPIPLDDWERYRVRSGATGSSANSSGMYIPPRFRRNVLLARYGHTQKETDEAIRLAKVARRRRSMTRTMLPMAGIEEAGETVAGLAKKIKDGRRPTKRRKAIRRDSAHF